MFHHLHLVFGFVLCPHVTAACSFWLQVPTGRCSSLWLFLDCSVCHQTGRCSPQLVLVSASSFSHICSTRQDAVVLSWRWVLVVSHHIGDGQGRECFDTFPRFVVGDPSARFETHTPLTYETNGRGNPSGRRSSATFSWNALT